MTTTMKLLRWLFLLAGVVLVIYFLGAAIFNEAEAKQRGSVRCGPVKAIGKVESEPFGTDLAIGMVKAEFCDFGRFITASDVRARKVITSAGDAAQWNGRVVETKRGCRKVNGVPCAIAWVKARFKFVQRLLEFRAVERMKVKVACRARPFECAGGRVN